MKHVGSLLSRSAAYGAALLTTSLAASAHVMEGKAQVIDWPSVFRTPRTTSAQLMEGKAEVKAIRGNALVSEADGQAFKPLIVGQSLGRGAVIKTGPDSQVDLFLKYNGPAIQLASSTTLRLNELSFEPRLPPAWSITRLNLSNGRILGYTQALTPRSGYEIRTPKSHVMIWGATVFDASANGTVTINQGSAHLVFLGKGAPPPPIAVNAGFTFNPPAPGRQNQELLRATPPESFNALALSINALIKNIPPKFTQGIIPPSQQGSNSSAPAVSTLETNRPAVKP